MRQSELRSADNLSGCSAWRSSAPRRSAARCCRAAPRDDAREDGDDAGRGAGRRADRAPRSRWSAASRAAGDGRPAATRRRPAPPPRRARRAGPTAPRLRRGPRGAGDRRIGGSGTGRRVRPTAAAPAAASSARKSGWAGVPRRGAGEDQPQDVLARQPAARGERGAPPHRRSPASSPARVSQRDLERCTELATRAYGGPRRVELSVVKRAGGRDRGARDGGGARRGSSPTARARSPIGARRRSISSAAKSPTCGRGVGEEKP